LKREISGAELGGGGEEKAPSAVVSCEKSSKEKIAHGYVKNEKEGEFLRNQDVPEKEQENLGREASKTGGICEKSRKGRKGNHKGFQIIGGIIPKFKRPA